MAPKESPKEQSELGFVSIENIFRPISRVRASIGDFFFTTKGVYFLRYFDFQHNGSLGGFVATALGGITGGIAASLSDAQNRNTALAAAAQTRTKQFGTRMQDRMSAKPRSLFVPREELRHLEADPSKGKIVLDFGDTRLEVFAAINRQTAAELSAYFAGTSSPQGIYGLDLIPPGPRDFLLSWVRDRQWPGDGSIFRSISRARRFLLDVFIAFINLSGSDKASVLARLENMPREFTSSFRDVVRREGTAQTGKVRFNFYMWLVGTIICGFLVTATFITGAAGQVGNLVMFGVICAACFIFMASEFRKLRRYSSAKSILLDALPLENVGTKTNGHAKPEGN